MIEGRDLCPAMNPSSPFPSSLPSPRLSLGEIYNLPNSEVAEVATILDTLRLGGADAGGAVALQGVDASSVVDVLVGAAEGQGQFLTRERFLEVLGGYLAALGVLVAS